MQQTCQWKFQACNCCKKAHPQRRHRQSGSKCSNKVQRKKLTIRSEPFECTPDVPQSKELGSTAALKALTARGLCPFMHMIADIASAAHLSMLNVTGSLLSSMAPSKQTPSFCAYSCSIQNLLLTKWLAPLQSSAPQIRSTTVKVAQANPHKTITNKKVWLSSYGHDSQYAENA